MQPRLLSCTIIVADKSRYKRPPLPGPLLQRRGGNSNNSLVRKPRFHCKMLYRLATAVLLAFPFFVRAAVLEIQLPPEVNAFKQDVGAEIVNAQCLVCHSVEYV